MHILIAAAAILLPTVFLLRFLATTSIHHIAAQSCRAIADLLHLHQTYTVPQFDPTTLLPNPLYSKVAAYLSSLQPSDSSSSSSSAVDFTTNLLSGPNPSHDIILSVDPRHHPVRDQFLSAPLSWSNHPSSSSSPAVGRTFVLRLRKKDKRRILRPYLQHILSVSDDVGKEIELFTNLAATDSPDELHGRWRAIPFTHPATMESVVMDGDLKGKIKSDLESFLKSKQYYHRLGRVWKRSFLLHGASGTGKSSFVSAMARFLGFDLYEIDVSKIADDSDLRTILLQTTTRSVVVIEDLDRLLANSGNLSLGGVLNFMDGVMCEERVMVYTMSSKDGVDPAVLRPGRIDVQIHFPLCDFPAFKTLASNYLGVKEHKLFPQVEEVFSQPGGASLSPAEIGEIMISNRGSPSRALKSVITALQAASTAASDGRAIRLLGESRSMAAAGAEGDVGGVFCRESVHTVRDFRKLYGLLRIGSRRKEESSVHSSEMGGGGVSGPLEKDPGRIDGGGGAKS